MRLSAVAVINSPLYDGNISNIQAKDDMWRYLHLLSADPERESISRIKNLASRIATRAHAFYSKKAWKRDINIEQEKGYFLYFRADGKGYYDDHFLELIITDGFWTDV